MSAVDLSKNLTGKLYVDKGLTEELLRIKLATPGLEGIGM